MKKLVFSLLATVLFSGFSFGNEINPTIINTKTIFNTLSKENLVSNKSLVIWCQTNVSISISIGIIEVGTTVNICCGTSNAAAGFGGMYCWTFNKPAPNDLVLVAEISSFGSNVQNHVKLETTKTISITKKIDLDIEGVKYNVLPGTHNIVSSNGIKYLSITAKKV